MTTPTTPPPRKVLVALDGSPAAATALPFARVLAARLAARVEGLYCAAGTQPEAEQAQIHEQLQEGETLHVVWPTDTVTAAFLEAAADTEVIVLTLTTHGRVVAPRRHLGHMTEAVVANTARPILLVRPEAAVSPAGARTLGLRHLLLPLDGTPSTAVALQPVTDLACRLGLAIDLLYVASPSDTSPAERGSIRPPRYVDQPQHEWPQWTQEVIDRLCLCLANCPPTLTVRMFLAQGEIGAEIARFAAAHETDVIALVRSSQLEPGRAKVLRYLLHRTPCPILIVSGVTLTPSTRLPGATPVAAIGPH
jgi:nucleotide-binding universal stress UspA family protein